MSLTIKHSVAVPKESRNQFRAFLNNISGQTNGATITFNTIKLKNQAVRFNYTMIIDNGDTGKEQQIAQELQNQITDGAIKHGGF